jgi:hypothetical protein
MVFISASNFRLFSTGIPRVRCNEIEMDRLQHKHLGLPRENQEHLTLEKKHTTLDLYGVVSMIAECIS